MDNNNIDLNSFSSHKNTGKKKNTKKSKKKKRIILLSIVLSLVIIISCFVGYGVRVMTKINRDKEFNNEDLSNLGITQVIDENVINIALFGVDARQVGDFSGRSDSIMILSVNKKNSTLKLVSVMRDSLVPINNNGKTVYNKINTAYSLGGPTLAVKTLNTLFGLDIKDYVTVNFYAMADIIDAMGGIEVEITKDEITADLGINTMIKEICYYLKVKPDSYLITKPGKQKLNGVQAVAYSRIRHAKNAMGSNNDFGRTERQRLVLELLLEKVLDTSPLKYPSIVNKLAPYIKTSLSNSEILSMGKSLVNRPSMIQSRIPHDKYIINADFRGTGASSVYYNYEFAGKVLRAFLYDDISPEDYFKENGVDKTGWFKSSGATVSRNESASQQSRPENNATPSAPTQDDDGFDTSSDALGDNENDLSSDVPSDESGDTSGDESGNTSSEQMPSDEE